MSNPYTLELKGNQLFIDNSTLSTITTCPRKAAYGVLARRQQCKPRAALFFGGAIHKALEVRDMEQQILCTAAIEEKMINALVEYFSDCDDSDDYRNLSYAIRTIEQYNKTFPADPQVAITLPSGEVAVELPFALPMGEVHICDSMWVKDPDINNGDPQFRHIDTIQIVFTGKMDRICEKNGRKFLLDHKTTSMGGPTFFDEFYTSHQFRGYKWATEQLLGIEVAGVIINALVCRPPLKSGSVNYTFDRQEILIDSDQVRDWQTSFLQAVETFLGYHVGQPEQERPESAYPMHTNTCIGKYGKCEFFDVCQLTPAHRNAMLFSGLYETNTWNPLEDKAKPKTREPMSFPGLF
jgi:hypothetical protein